MIQNKEVLLVVAAALEKSQPLERRKRNGI